MKQKSKAKKRSVSFNFSPRSSELTLPSSLLLPFLLPRSTLQIARKTHLLKLIHIQHPPLLQLSLLHRVKVVLPLGEESDDVKRVVGRFVTTEFWKEDREVRRRESREEG